MNVSNCQTITMHYLAILRLMQLTRKKNDPKWLHGVQHATLYGNRRERFQCFSYPSRLEKFIKFQNLMHVFLLKFSYLHNQNVICVVPSFVGLKHKPTFY